MANKIFASWTWIRGGMKAFGYDFAHTVSTVHTSRYNTVSKGKSTLHGATVRVLEKGINLIYSDAACGGIGVKGDTVFAEYPSSTGDLHCVIYNETLGSFKAGIFNPSTGECDPYILAEDKQSGAALLFAMLPAFLKDTEFKESYDSLSNAYNNGDTAEMEGLLYILCDNIYRRIEGCATLGVHGIHAQVSATGNIAPIIGATLKTQKPDKILFGNLQVFSSEDITTKTTAASTPISPTAFEGRYAFSARTFNAEEQNLIPTLPDWYIVPREVEKICNHALKTTESAAPMRNFMMRGPAGTGKTLSARAIAAGLGLPYVSLTCSANTEISDLIGQLLPDTENSAVSCTDLSLPTFEDISFDPPTAYARMTGEYDESVTEDMVYRKLIETIRAQESGTSDTVHYRYVESDLVRAMRNGWVIELQEPSVIANPGVLVGLNAALDDTGTITLPTGEVVHRHPDTVFVITTNNDYAGCKQVNQSIISRMKLVLDVDGLDADTMCRRTCGITGCTSTATVKLMAEAVLAIDERCRQTMITDGSSGMRELIAWVQSYMVDGDVMEAAKDTILASVSVDPDNRADILTTCLQPRFAS